MDVDARRFRLALELRRPARKAAGPEPPALAYWPAELGPPPCKGASVAAPWRPAALAQTEEENPAPRA